MMIGYSSVDGTVWLLIMMSGYSSVDGLMRHGVTADYDELL